MLYIDKVWTELMRRRCS